MQRRQFVRAAAAISLLPNALTAQSPSPVADSTSRRVIAGSANQIDGTTAADQLFAELLQPDTNVLYLTIAAEDENPHIARNHNALWALAEPMGVTAVDVWTRADTKSSDFEPDLDAYSGIYIGNGDPTTLLRQLHLTGLFWSLIEAANRGCVLYGTSAGTKILSENALAAETPRKLKEPDRLTPTEVYGLDVIGDRDGNGIIPVPHWRNGRTTMWEEAARLTGQNVLLIPDGSAWTLVDGEYNEIGDEPLIWLEVDQLDG